MGDRGRGGRRNDSRGRGGGGSGGRGRDWKNKIIDRFKIDDAAQRKLGYLSEDRQESILSTIEGGEIRNPSAFIMKAASNAQDRQEGGRGRGRSRSRSRRSR